MTSSISRDVASASAGVLHWIGSSASSINDANPEDQLRAIIACAVCRDFCPRRALRCRELASAFVKAIGRATLRTLLECGGPLVLLGYLAASRLQMSAPTLARYAQIAVQELRESSASAANREMAASATLLWRIGLLAGAPQRPPLRVDAQAALFASRAKALAALANLEAATAFGTKAITAEDALTDVLDAAAMAGLQDCDFDFACRALRARSYLSNGAHLATKTARRFLLSNQDFDGSFGFFDREIELLRFKSCRPDPRVRVKMPVTLACLWTIAEMESSNYRLFRDVGTR